jgi:thioredoxin-related protein
MFAISTDDERTVAKVKPLVKSKGFDFPVLFDSNLDISRLYYAQSVPYSVILDKKGMIIYSHLGYMKGDEIKVKEIISSQINK